MAPLQSNLKINDPLPMSKMYESIPLLRNNTSESSLADQIYEYVLKEIVFPEDDGRHEIEYGGRITESTLAKELNTSNGPVREAIYRLRQEGWIHTIGNRGSFLVDFSNQRIAREIYKFRISLETGAFYSLASNITSAQKQTLRQILDVIEEAKANSDVSTFRKADTSFHLQVVEFAGGVALRQLLRPKLLQWYAMSYHLLKQPAEVDKYRHNLEAPQRPSHKDLMSSLESGNGAQAAQLIVEHQSYISKLLHIDSVEN